MAELKLTELARMLEPFLLKVGESTVTQMLNAILLYDSGGAAIADFPFTSAGFELALAAWTSGDVIFLPAGTIPGDHTITAKVIGLSRFGSILSGQITAGAGGSIENLSINRNASSASPLIGLYNGVSGTFRVANCHIEVENTGVGGARAIDIAYAGILEAWNSYIFGNASGGGNGYGGYWDGLSAGTLSIFGGWVRGSATPFN